jgi:hypothetical protein
MVFSNSAAANITRGNSNGCGLYLASSYLLQAAAPAAAVIRRQMPCRQPFHRISPRDAD